VCLTLMGGNMGRVNHRPHPKPRWVARGKRENLRTGQRRARWCSRRDFIITCAVSIIAGYVKDFVTWLSTARVRSSAFRATSGAIAGKARFVAEPWFDADGLLRSRERRQRAAFAVLDSRLVG
jgi:hypothetical protein